MTGADLAGFLSRYPPFTNLDEAALTSLANAAHVDAYQPGQMVLDAFATPSVEAFVVVTGTVELWNDVDGTGLPADETLGPGGVFGFSAMLTERSVGPLAVAVGPATVARLPAAAVEPVFVSRRGSRFLAERLSAVVPHHDPLTSYSTVSDLVRTRALVVGPRATVADVARRMSQQASPYAVVRLGEGRLGLVTDALLREQVIVEGMPGSAPARRIATEATTVLPDSSAAEALILLLDRHAEFLVVVERGGELVGVVGPRDFVVAPTTAGVVIHEQLRLARTVEELVERAHRIPDTLEDLLSHGLASDKVIAVYSSDIDALVRRAIALVLEQHPSLSPEAFTWMSLGSNGRREAVLSSDVDSAVALDDSVPAAQVEAYRRAFAEIDAVLARAGVSTDEHGATAAHPLFSRTNTEWRTAARRWLAAPASDNGAMMTSLLLDGRPIHGDLGLPAVTTAFSELRRHPLTMRLLLRESLAQRARMRSIRDLLARPDTFQLKSHAILPVVNLARWAALVAGSSTLRTTDRLRAASGTAMLPEDRATTLVEVFGLLQRLRLRYQLMQRSGGDRPSDVLTLDRLSPIDRSLVSEAVREIAQIQRRMTNVAQYVPEEDWTAAAT